MNSLEAYRVLSVLDEGLEGFRLFSYFTEAVLESADQLVDVLGQDITHCMVKYRLALSKSHGQIACPDVSSNTLELWRKLRHAPDSEHKLRSLQIERSAAMLQLISCFTDLKAFSQKNLTTTVEEDISNRESYQEVKDREDKALTEKTQKEQKLRLERIERQKQMSQVTGAEATAKADLDAIIQGAASTDEALRREATATRARDQVYFLERQAQLSKDIAAANDELQRIRAHNQESEIALRKMRKKLEQAVEASIMEYDTEMGEREKEYQQELSVYEEVQKQLEEFEAGWTRMRAERLEYEETKRNIAETERAEACRRILINHMARTIQTAWRAFKSAKEAAKKAEGKKKGKKGKGKK